MPEDMPPPPGTAKPKIEPPTAEEMRRIGHLVTIAARAPHNMLADSTGWAGWRLNSEDEQAWDALGSAIVRRIQFKYLDILFAALAVMAVESAKGAAFASWKKAQHPKEPEGGVAQSATPDARILTGGTAPPASANGLVQIPGLT